MFGLNINVPSWAKPAAYVVGGYAGGRALEAGASWAYRKAKKAGWVGSNTSTSTKKKRRKRKSKEAKAEPKVVALAKK